MILIADPQYLTGKGLQDLLTENDMEAIWYSGDNLEGVFDKLDALRPDMVITEYGSHYFYNAACLRQVKSKYPDMRVMIVSDENSKTLITQALDLGVNGFLTKQCSREEILNAVTAIKQGSKFFCNKVLDVLLDKRDKTVEDCSPTQLSDRELEIVTLLTKGHNTKAIAKELNLSQHTIYTHRKNIMKKLSISSAQELIIYAMNSGLVN
jgi:DNA-binding NarL/FixJ family response regulator